jgi:hypothetical protein
MLKIIKTEIIYFIVILLLLAVLQHADLLSSPLARIGLMAQKGNYLHPLLWTTVVYSALMIVRVITKYLIKIVKR